MVKEEEPAHNSREADVQPTEQVQITIAQDPVVQSPPKENKWAEIVRKGRSKEVSSATVGATPSTPATTATSSGKTTITPSSPTAALTPSAPSRKENSVSPSRTRRSRGGARRKEDSIPGKVILLTLAIESSKSSD